MKLWIDEPAQDYQLTSTKPVRHSPCGTAKRRAKARKANRVARKQRGHR